MSGEVRHELQGLLSALCDGQLSEPQHARLEELLAADAECRRLYLEYVDLHARLLLHPGLGAATPPQPAATPVAGHSRRTASVLLRYGLVSAATLAASLLVQVFWWPRPGGQGGTAPPPAAVATLTQAADCVWDDAGDARRPGGRLVPGELRLQKGLARVRFDDGPELVIEGPATVRLDSATAATVLRGKVVFRGAEGAAPFDLRTPAATLLDRGTEYAVAVEPDGEEVHVFDGEVERLPERGAAEYLRKGEARRYGPGPDDAGRPTALNPDGFVRQLPAPPRPPDDGLLAYEGFDYRDPNAIADGTANGGRGWLGPWKLDFARPLNEGDTNRLTLNVKDGLTRPGAPEASRGGAFQYAGFTKCFRRLATPVRMDVEGVTYLSYLFRRDAPSDDPTNAVAVLLRTTEEIDPAHDDPRKRLNIGVGGPNEIFTHLNRVGSRTPVPLNYGETYFLVAKIVTGTAGPNQVFVRVYGPQEAVERDEPANWSVIGKPFQSDLTFDWLQVHVNSKARQTIDEIRLGTTWAAVTAPLAAAPRKVGRP